MFLSLEACLQALPPQEESNRKLVGMHPSPEGSFSPSQVGVRISKPERTVFIFGYADPLDALERILLAALQLALNGAERNWQPIIA
jgi:hypothetical protein